MFAGSCLRVILLVVSLEFLCQLGKEYDRYLVRKHIDNNNNMNMGASSFHPISTSVLPSTGRSTSAALKDPQHNTTTITRLGGSGGFKPSLPQQVISALLHMVQFAVAYFIML